MSVHSIPMVLTLMLFAANPEHEAQSRSKATAAAWDRLETAAFNQSLEMSFVAKESWTRNPITVALQFVGESDDLPSSRTIQMTKLAPDRDDTVAVEITDDGLADDSVRGEKYRFELVKTDAGLWKVAKAFKAWRCQPGRGHQEYSAKPCI